MDFKAIPAIDSHVHLYNKDCIDSFIKYRTDNNFTAVNVACLCNLDAAMENDPAQNILAAIIKLKDGHFYAHGGLVYPKFPVEKPIPQGYDFAEQIDELWQMGFDGFKMLESKPTVRKLTDIPVCDEVFDGVYEYLSQNKIPVVSHVADPETFWDKDKAPEFSFAEGWFYGDGTFETKEAIYAEVNRVVEKYPDVLFTFPHFFFLSDDPARAREFLDEHPNVCFDITPGREMYDNFTRHYDETRALFMDYYRRIMFGTDTSVRYFAGNESAMIEAIKRFLTTSDSFVFEDWGFDMKGLDLPGDVSRAILHDNFLCRVGKTPRKIDRKALARYIEKRGEGVRDEATKAYIYNFAENEL